MSFVVRIEGVPRLQAKLAPGLLLGPPIKRLLERWAITVESEAKRGAPVDTGRLRASITHRLDAAPVPLFAEVGTNVTYARPVHEGRRAGARQPPSAALAVWARRHGGGNPFLIARAIGRRGIKARPFLRNAAQASASQLAGFVATCAKEIEAAFGGR